MPGSDVSLSPEQLADVMRESVDARILTYRSQRTYTRRRHVEFKEYDLHVHFPAGAIPKDGPSAGCGRYSRDCQRVEAGGGASGHGAHGRDDAAGKVLEIGGVKKKVMAAYRAGLRQVLLPKANEKDCVAFLTKSSTA